MLTFASVRRMSSSKFFSRVETAESTGRSTYIHAVLSSKSSSTIGSVATPSLSSIAACSAMWSITGAGA
ncbi:hypothetical protein BGY98DRAFT_1024109 [Russula aff. rugulosa BPL654]|nr:hypothetical protein BGY98DRAFT_1024109 [Russula aff. rugulosa BPL654]